ncbi:beta-ketoacyl synthase N-terminal-like domain-containing protein [Streptomyces sp. NPDC059835]|uniref:beta-ketoacyl synthase N-terminal-like domain-containing protein n=1 Tax=Streptomyces sp. NPDC059835 TaxID=3346967 RepID=UPI00364887C7
MNAVLAAPATTAVFTGIGVAAPGGLGTAAWWAAVLRGESGIGPVTRFDASPYPVRIAGEVPGFVDEDHVSSRLLPQTDRVTRLSLAAAQEAIDDSGAEIAALPPYAAGVVTANSSGGFEFGHRELQALWSQGPQHVSAYQSFAWFYAVNSGQISIKHGLRGASGVVVSEQAGGLDAVAHARRQLRKGARLVVTGGLDSTLCPWGWAAHLAGGSMSTVPDPARAYLPFDEDASGHVVFADAAGERAADRAEAEAIAAVFGPYTVPVTAPKSMAGRLSSGGAALDLAAALLALRDQVVPPTTGTVRPAADCPVDLVTGTPRTGKALRTALVLARGRGGFNAAAVVRAA